MGQSYMYSLYCTQGLFYSFVLYNWEEIFFTVKGDSCLLFRTLAAFHWLKYWINLVTLSPSQLINIKPEVTYYFYRCLKIQGKYRIFFHSHPIPELGTRQYFTFATTTMRQYKRGLRAIQNSKKVRARKNFLIEYGHCAINNHVCPDTVVACPAMNIVHVGPSWHSESYKLLFV